jgi:hypothetical protein
MTGVSIMAAGDVPSSVVQCIIIKFLCSEGEKAADIHHHFQLQLGKSAFRVLLCLPWCQLFKDDCEPVLNMPHFDHQVTEENQGPVCIDFLLEKQECSLLL